MSNNCVEMCVLNLQVLVDIGQISSGVSKTVLNKKIYLDGPPKAAAKNSDINLICFDLSEFLKNPLTVESA